MFSSKVYIFSAVFALISCAAAHGQVTGIVAGGKYYQGYVPSEQGSSIDPGLAAWSIPEDSSNGPVYPSGYNTPDIVCHVGATAGAVEVRVAAGATVELEWTEWPVTHHGPVIDYLANCNGPCDTVDKSSLKFNKIDAVGLIGESTGPGAAGFWGADKLRTSNNTWTVTIPSAIAEGNYVLRHEIIALHSARTVDGAQNYPHCINLQVTGSGTDKLPSGTVGTALYKPGEPGIQIDIYKPLKYTMPGPPLYKAGATTEPADSGLGGGLDNLGMDGAVSASISVASQSQTMGTASSVISNVVNAVSASISVHGLSTSPMATATSTATIASAPWSNSTGANMTMATSMAPITTPISIAAASTNFPSLTGAGQTPSSLVDNLSASVGSVAVNAAATSISSNPSTTSPLVQLPAATSTTPNPNVIDTAMQQSTPASGAASASSTTKTYASMPEHPTQSTFSGLSVGTLMEYLRAITAELSSKVNIGQSKRRRHARDVGSS